MAKALLYEDHELSFRTQYAEVKERVRAAGRLLPGTPGTLALRRGTGHPHWYRVFYPVPGKQAEEWVCGDGDSWALEEARNAIEFSAWVAAQVVALRKLGYQVADKVVARVMVELHNQEVFEAGLVLVGTLCFMAWLNELGIRAVSARTQDIDLARRQSLKLAAPLPFLSTLKATGLPFSAVPGLPSAQPSTTVKLPGAQGLRVDVLAPGATLGGLVQVPELSWVAQTIPYYDYLLEEPESGAVLAGGHCIPVRLPQAGRLVWHKFYASLHRRGFPEKAAKDRAQALLLAAVLLEQEPAALRQALLAAPRKMAKEIRASQKLLLKGAVADPALADGLRDCLGGPGKKT